MIDKLYGRASLSRLPAVLYVRVWRCNIYGQRNARFLAADYPHDSRPSSNFFFCVQSVYFTDRAESLRRYNIRYDPILMEG